MISRASGPSAKTAIVPVNDRARRPDEHRRVAPAGTLSVKQVEGSVAPAGGRSL